MNYAFKKNEAQTYIPGSCAFYQKASSFDILGERAQTQSGQYDNEKKKTPKHITLLKTPKRRGKIQALTSKFIDILYLNLLL